MVYRPKQKMLDILVIHGYVQSAVTVAANTVPLRKELDGVAKLHYVDGPPMNRGAGSRPWWILDNKLEHNSSSNRWEESVKWWSEELSKNQYDGVIGLSQGSAMAGLLVSMLNHPERVPGFDPQKSQPIKFAIFCSGFVSHLSPHKGIYGIPDNLPTLHTVDDHDFVVPAARTIELQGLCKKSVLGRHNEGHSIPVHGTWPEAFRKFILDAVSSDSQADSAKGL